MLESSLEFIRYVRCGAKLDLEVLNQNQEIEEGTLKCKKRNLQFSIIEKTSLL